jgi:hypothetical protein
MTKIYNYLLSPEKYLYSYTSVLIGFIVAFCLSLSAFYFQVRFDGVLDFHISMSKTPFQYLIIEQLIVWLSLGITFYIIPKIIKSKIRFVDILGLVGIARFHFLIIAIIYGIMKPFINIDFFSGKTQNEHGDIIFLLLFIFVLLICFTFYIIYLYKAFKTNTNFTGSKLIISFLISLFSAEILSKFIIIFTFKSINL